MITPDGWTRSDRCGISGCIDVRRTDTGAVQIRTEYDRAPITATSAEWRDFIAAVKDGEFDQVVPR